MKETAVIVHTIENLLKLVDMLMPGLRHIAVDDYALVNEAPIKARALIAELRRQA